MHWSSSSLKGIFLAIFILPIMSIELSMILISYQWRFLFCWPWWSAPLLTLLSKRHVINADKELVWSWKEEASLVLTFKHHLVHVRIKADFLDKFCSSAETEIAATVASWPELPEILYYLTAQTQMLVSLM